MATTYVTLSTPWGEGGINIIELIGPRAQHLVSEVFKAKRVTLSGKPEQDRLYLGYIYDKNRPILRTLSPQDERVDEVIINFIPAKESFTGLDTIEINSHGGIMPAKKIMTLLKARGAREITMRQMRQLALKHKRLDTIQAEALEALQSAPTLLVSQVLLDQYNGALSREVQQILAHMGKTQTALLNKLTKLLDLARFGLALTNPRRIVIGGLPNVGKSTLFNALVGQEKVIVHHLPGTTRDMVEEIISIEGIPFSLRDTAGLDDLRTIKTSHQIVEKESIKKAKGQVREADLIIFLLDGSQPLPREMKQVMKLLNNRPADRVGSPILYVLNKNDLPPAPLPQKTQRHSPKAFGVGLGALVVNSAISISALYQRGLEKLRKSILDSLQLTPDLYQSGKAIVFTKRQYDLLKQAYQIVKSAKTPRAITRVRGKLEKLIYTDMSK